MDFLSSSHTKFMKTVVVSSQLSPNIYTSSAPTFVFLIFSFIFLYQYFHRTTTRYTRWKTKLFRNCKLHWFYFNATRFWFVLLACFRKMVNYTDGYIETNMLEKDQHFNKTLTYVTILAVLSSLALIPLFLIYLNYLYKNDIPNFLMWVVEDPWLRHEIGISGHCLERPLTLGTSKLKNCSYRSRRSNSFDSNPWIKNGNEPVLCRNCRSMMERNVISSIDDLLK